jgi:hypothetical protein
MTNHPNRRRDVTGDAERDLAAADALAGQLEHAEPGDIPPQGSAEIPGHTGNGVPPGLRPNAAKIIGATVADAIGEVLPPLLAQALSSVTRQHYCATCLVDRLNWEIAHEADLKASVQEMNTAAMAMPPGDPRRDQLNPFMFLAPHLLPSQDPENPHPDAIPDPSLWTTMVGGTLFCTIHVPGVNRPRDAPKRPLLVATANPVMRPGGAG